MEKGAIQVLPNAVGGGSAFPKKKHYEVVRFNVIRVTRGCVWVKFQGKKRYVQDIQETLFNVGLHNTETLDQ